ncbi:hypothetical protein H0X48_04030 [Candidatus Dependentiae bacterium]|nr:hypothetical protein [Candidatus Dependentiae bacterium]
MLLVKHIIFLSTLLLNFSFSAAIFKATGGVTTHQVSVEEYKNKAVDKQVVIYSKEPQDTKKIVPKKQTAQCCRRLVFTLLGVANLIMGLMGISQW